MWSQSQSQSQFRPVYQRQGFSGYGWMPFVLGWLFLSFLFWGGFKMLGILIPLMFIGWVVGSMFRAARYQGHYGGWNRWNHQYRGETDWNWDSGWGHQKRKNDEKRKNDWLSMSDEMPIDEAKPKRDQNGDRIFYV